MHFIVCRCKGMNDEHWTLLVGTSNVHELIVIDDLLYAMAGIDGRYISIRRGSKKEDVFSFQFDPSMDLILQVRICGSVLSLGRMAEMLWVIIFFRCLKSYFLVSDCWCTLWFPCLSLYKDLFKVLMCYWSFVFPLDSNRNWWHYMLDMCSYPCGHC